MPSQLRLLFFALIAVVIVVLSGTASGQAAEVTCFGVTVEQAEANGYRVQIGTEGGDVLVGGNVTKDMLIGLGGEDVLTGAGANDIICGGDGDDTITGGTGDDRIDGGDGDDELNLGEGNDSGRGGAGADRIVGGSGDDLLDGGIGNDELSGEDGDDELFGFGGKDVLYGGYGEDRVVGGGGDDRLHGGPDRDRLSGGRGNDILSGNRHRDRLAGGPGDDVLDGDENRDRLHGGRGQDRCRVHGSDMIRHCEVDFAGGVLPRPAPEPEPEPEPEPPEGEPVPAAQAPQGTNQFGWPLLTDVGLEALLQCESGGNHAANTGNRFYGGVQWLPATWNAAARGSGFSEYDGVLPHLVPADVQDAAAKWWWEATRPNTQWPHCHVFALVAMNVLAP